MPEIKSAERRFIEIYKELFRFKYYYIILGNFISRWRKGIGSNNDR